MIMLRRAYLWKVHTRVQTSHETEITIDSHLTVWPYPILLKFEGLTPTGTSTWQKQIQSSCTIPKIVLFTNGERVIYFLLRRDLYWRGAISRSQPNKSSNSAKKNTDGPTAKQLNDNLLRSRHHLWSWQVVSTARISPATQFSAWITTSSPPQPHTFGRCETHQCSCPNKDDWLIYDKYVLLSQCTSRCQQITTVFL